MALLPGHVLAALAWHLPALLPRHLDRDVDADVADRVLALLLMHLPRDLLGHLPRNVATVVPRHLAALLLRHLPRHLPHDGNTVNPRHRTAYLLGNALSNVLAVNAGNGSAKLTGDLVWDLPGHLVAFGALDLVAGGPGLVVALLFLDGLAERCSRFPVNLVERAVAVGNVGLSVSVASSASSSSGIVAANLPLHHLALALVDGLGGEESQTLSSL